MFRDKLLGSICKQVVARLSDCETTGMAYFIDTDNRLFVCETVCYRSYPTPLWRIIKAALDAGFTF